MITFKYSELRLYSQINQADVILTEELIRQTEKEAQGSSYPKYVQKLKGIGIGNYEVRVKNHNRKFTASDGQEILVSGDLPLVECADEFDPAAIKSAIRRSQEGLTDYPTFVAEIAAAGVHHYLADLGAMKILYMGRDAGNLYTELIPTAD